MLIEEFKAKTIIRTSYPSIFSWSEVYLNPYQGCFHDCIYCDGKSESYHMHEDFASRIRVKTNAPDLFERFLKKKGFSSIHSHKNPCLTDFFPTKSTVKSRQPGKFIITIGGGVCDTYQPAEKQVKLTRKLLKITRDYRFPVIILTKSVNVLRDLDLIRDINEDSYACVNFSITLADEEKQKIFEPGASTTSERFEAVRVLREKGIHSGVYFYPVLPFIGDTDENMHAIYRRAKKVGAEFVYTWRLTLKPGRNKKEFMQTLVNHFPALHPRYEKLYSNNNKYGNYDYRQLKSLGLVLQEVKAYTYNYDYKLPFTAPRYIPEGRIESNLRLSTIFRKLAYLKESIIKGKNTGQEARELGRAAMFLEKCPREVLKLNKEEFKRLPVAKSVHPYFTDYFLNGRSIYLEEHEEKAYHAASNVLID